MKWTRILNGLCAVTLSIGIGCLIFGSHIIIARDPVQAQFGRRILILGIWFCVWAGVAWLVSRYQSKG